MLDTGVNNKIIMCSLRESCKIQIIIKEEKENNWGEKSIIIIIGQITKIM